MADIMWFVGAIGFGIIGMLYGVWAEKQSTMRNFRQMQEDVFNVIYDWHTHPDKKTPPVLRLRSLDKYFNLDEIRKERGSEEFIDNIIIGGDDISSRVVNADGTQGRTRGVHAYD